MMRNANVRNHLKVAPYGFTIELALMTKAQLVCVPSKENISVFQFL